MWLNQSNGVIYIEDWIVFVNQMSIHLLFWRLIIDCGLAHSVGEGSEWPLLEIPVVEASEGGRCEGHVHVHGVHVVVAPPVQGPGHGPRHGPGLASAGTLVNGAVLGVQ